MKTFQSTVSSLLLALLLNACGSDSTDSLLASSRDYLAKNDSKAAVIQLKNALQQNPNLGEARFLLGSALLESGDVTGALVELRKALELKHPTDAVVPLLARAMLASGQAQKIIDEFGKTTLSPGEPQAALKTSLSTAYAMLGKSDNAKTLLMEALAADPEYVPARLADIRVTAANSDLAGASAKIDALLNKHPNNADALFLKGNLADATGNLTEALAQYQKTISAKPTYLMAHVAAISILLRDKKLDEATAQLVSLKKIAPKHPQTYLLDAQVNYQKKDFKTARESAQQLLRITPNHAGALQIAGAVEYQLRSYQQAETHLSKALQISPNLMLARRLLVATHLRSGQPAKAVEVLTPVLGSIEKDSGLLTLAGEAYLQNDDPDKAASYFEKASKLEPENSAKKTSLAIAHMAQGKSDVAFEELEQLSGSDSGITADLALVASHLRNNQLDKALKAIDQIEKKQPANPATHNLRGRALLAKKDAAGARKSFDKALSLNPTFFPAVSALAGLDILEKKPKEAQKRFENLLSADPKNVQALLTLAQLKVADGGTPAEVLTLIEKAVSAAPTEVVPRVALIQYHLKNKDNKKALSAANDANSSIPDKPEILDALGKTQQLSGDFNQALTTYSKLASMQPTSPLASIRIAEVHIANKNQDEAIKSLKKALEIKPDFVEVQRTLIQVAMQNKNPKEALNIARTVQKQRPKEAFGYIFEGDIHAANGSINDATGAYRSGLKQTNAPELAVKLNGAMLASGNAAEAEKMAAEWLKNHPKDILFRLYLGDLAGANKNHSQAVTHYLSALALQPNNALILNNLAWASSQTKSPKALEYAEKANQLAPDQPAFMDTLAVILADKGDTAKAIELLRKALTAAPQAAAIQLNLAKVLIKADKKTDARIELEALAKLGEKFSGHSEVTKLLNTL